MTFSFFNTGIHLIYFEEAAVKIHDHRLLKYFFFTFDDTICRDVRIFWLNLDILQLGKFEPMCKFKFATNRIPPTLPPGSIRIRY